MSAAEPDENRPSDNPPNDSSQVGSAAADAPRPSDNRQSSVAANGKSAGGLTWLALLLAVAALLAALYAAKQLREIPTPVSQSGASDARQFEQLGDELNARVDRLVRQSTEQRQAVADMQQALQQTVNSLADMPQRMAQVEAQVASVPGIDPRSRREFFQSEALYYLQIANAQAALADAPEVAVNALQLADDKLRQAANPALEGVRRRISADIAALRAVPELDTTGTSFRLQALATEVYNWPFRYSVPERFGNELPDSATADELGPWQRFKSVVQGVISSVVSVRKVDAAPEAQLAAVDQAIIRETVRAELQLARLALIDGNTELYQQALARVAEQTGRYFDTDASAVEAGLEQLAELAELELPGDLPEASSALQLMLSMSAALARQPEPPSRAEPTAEPESEPEPAPQPAPEPTSEPELEPAIPPAPGLGPSQTPEPAGTELRPAEGAAPPATDTPTEAAPDPAATGSSAP